MDASEIEPGLERWQRRYDEARLGARATRSGLPLDPVYGPPRGEVQ